MAVTESDIQSRLKTLVDPNTERDFVASIERWRTAG